MLGLPLRSLADAEQLVLVFVGPGANSSVHVAVNGHERTRRQVLHADGVTKLVRYDAFRLRRISLESLGDVHSAVVVPVLTGVKEAGRGLVATVVAKTDDDVDAAGTWRVRDAVAVPEENALVDGFAHPVRSFGSHRHWLVRVVDHASSAHHHRDQQRSHRSSPSFAAARSVRNANPRTHADVVAPSLCAAASIAAFSSGVTRMRRSSVRRSFAGTGRFLARPSNGEVFTLQSVPQSSYKVKGVKNSSDFECLKVAA